MVKNDDYRFSAKKADNVSGDKINRGAVAKNAAVRHVNYVAFVSYTSSYAM